MLDFALIKTKTSRQSQTDGGSKITEVVIEKYLGTLFNQLSRREFVIKIIALFEDLVGRSMQQAIWSREQQLSFQHLATVACTMHHDLFFEHKDLYEETQIMLARSLPKFLILLEEVLAQPEPSVLMPGFLVQRHAISFLCACAIYASWSKLQVDPAASLLTELLKPTSS